MRLLSGYHSRIEGDQRLTPTLVRRHWRFMVVELAVAGVLLIMAHRAELDMILMLVQRHLEDLGQTLGQVAGGTARAAFEGGDVWAGQPTSSASASCVRSSLARWRFIQRTKVRVSFMVAGEARLQGGSGRLDRRDVRFLSPCLCRSLYQL